MSLTYYPGNSLLVFADELKDSRSGAGFLTGSSTVTARVLDAQGQEVAGQSWPVSLSFVSGSSGRFEGVVDPDLVVSVGDQLTLEYSVLTPESNEALVKVPMLVAERAA